MLRGMKNFCGVLAVVLVAGSAMWAQDAKPAGDKPAPDKPAIANDLPADKSVAQTVEVAGKTGRAPSRSATLRGEDVAWEECISS